ncbi:hypothetical protein BJ742DRAFT_821725 [Cladochytrium replicatum]|nr:hypothetical protein BJ742DRAFT_821725 [Cladochytrium replicatum]
MDAFVATGVPHVVVAHPAAANVKEWAESLSGVSALGITTAVLSKTLFLKPKGGKDDPILVTSLESTTFGINPFVKSLGNKEARMAADDLIASVLKVDKSSVTPFALANVADKSKVTVVVEAALFSDPKAHIGFKAFSDDKTVFVKASDFKSFLDSNKIAFNSFDFSKLGAPGTPAAPAAKAAAPAPSAAQSSAAAAPSDEAKVQIGIEVGKAEDFPKWYQQVLKKTEMLEYYDVSGCYILRPWSFRIWKEVQKWFGGKIEDLGVEDCYFPIFVSKRALEKEKDHIEGFAPEVAWVTKAGETDLETPIAVRPTSETVMYPAYANWIRSHRDLPVRLNQWNNVVRWEFKHPQPFLRTREFLWQEGHTAFATKEEADAEVLQILDLYARVYEELLAVPVVKGKKSEKEKFAGGLYTTTVEGFVPTTGRGIQGATSHCLGNNFANMFDITFEDEDKVVKKVWQNSWGLSTRVIGVMVMVHGDDKGLVLPPRVAALQVVVIPVGITASTSDADRKKISEKADEIVSVLKDAGLRARADTRTYTPGHKFNHWEMKGVPLRLEVGPKDIQSKSFRAVRRDGPRETAVSHVPEGDLVNTVNTILSTIQRDMYISAKKERDAHLIRLETWDKFVSTLDGKNLVLVPWCERTECEDDVKERSSKSSEPTDEKAPSMGAKTLCIPFEQPKENPLVPGVTKCFACGHKAKSYTMFGRSY